MTARLAPKAHVERVIAAVRLIIAAASSLFAIWLDPAEPARNVAIPYMLHAL